MHNDFSIGYSPYSSLFDHPGDRRRFCAFANFKNLHFSRFDHNTNFKLVVISERSDFYYWAYRSETPFILDLIDSYFLENRFSLKSLFRSPAKYFTGTYSGFSFSYPRLLSDVCQKASYVICSTPEQSKHILTLNQNVQPILDCYQVDNFSLKTNYSSSDPFRIVWEGQPNNLKHLKLVLPVLLELRKKYNIVLDIVTKSHGFSVLGSYFKYSVLDYLKSFPLPYIFHDWTTMNLSNCSTRADLAILPIPSHDKFVYNKPENRLLCFWSMGIPTLTSSTPAYKRTMDSAGLYDYCSDLKEWYDKLELFILSKSNRERSGKLGLNYYLSYHTDLHRFGLWNKVFTELGIY